jgi:tetratricopeptide (TPR) repeat protein
MGPVGRTGKALLIVGLGLAVFAVGSLGLLRSGRSNPPPASVPAGAGGSLQLHPSVGAQSLAQVIAGLQARLRVLPNDWQSFASLGSAYVQEARITADPSYYPKAQAALRRSLAIQPRGNFPALTGLGTLALARHDFSGALALGQRAATLDPYNAAIRGVVGDAFIELGRYPEAFAQFQKMIDLRPNLSSWARVSYARELQGDVAGARQAMGTALQESGSAEDRAWVLNQLGDLAFNNGDLTAASRSYAGAHQVDPAFVPPLAGLAKVSAARGDVRSAITQYAAITARYPLPEYVVALADLYTVTNQPALLQRQVGLVRAEEALFRANGVDVDLEIALFDADHHLELSQGLAAARAEWGRRHSVHVADALGWELYANGQTGEALTYANQALHLGTRSALFHFHRAMIERALGKTAAARTDLQAVAAINPHFSTLWASTAARLLSTTGAGA